MRRAAVLATGLLLGAAGAACAHTTSTGLAVIDATSADVALRLTLVPTELGESAADVVRGAAGDAASAGRVAAWLHADVALAVDGAPCRIKRTRLQAARGDERVALLLDFACPAVPGRLVVDDRLSTQFGEHYRTIVSVTGAGGTREERVLDRAQPRAEFDFGRERASGWLDFIRLGIAHIGSGADHLLFLAALLIGGRSVGRLLVVVTAFTVAHSLSLALAVLGHISLAPAIVEPAIAASIVWVAIENLRLGPASTRRRVLLTFAFGLVHGLGFAEALRDLDLERSGLVRALLGFNVGVEAAQLLVVLTLAPLLAWAARVPGAQRWERAGSGAIALIGAFWLIERSVSAS